MRTKRDYSRLVAIDLSPTEAAILFGYLRTALKLIPEETVEGVAKKLFKQLHGLDWPMEVDSFIVPRAPASAGSGDAAAEASEPSPASTKP